MAQTSREDNTLKKHNDEIKSAERRNFLKLAGMGSFTAALVAGAAGSLWSTEVAAQTANEERDREAAAEHVMTIATAYVLGATRSYPIMQLDLKENIQNATNGKVYVKLAPGGQLGSGGELVQKVQGGTIQAAQHSISNFAPFAPVTDLINLPYLCGSNQRFTNLVHSDVWATEVNPKVEAAGFKPLFYVNIDPRVVAVRKGGAGAVLSPSDLSGVKFRVPGSAMLQQYYRMVGANPTPVAWGETPSAIKQGVADALDPSVGALYVFCSHICSFCGGCGCHDAFALRVVQCGGRFDMGVWLNDCWLSLWRNRFCESAPESNHLGHDFGPRFDSPLGCLACAAKLSPCHFKWNVFALEVDCVQSTFAIPSPAHRQWCFDNGHQTTWPLHWGC